MLSRNHVAHIQGLASIRVLQNVPGIYPVIFQSCRSSHEVVFSIIALSTHCKLPRLVCVCQCQRHDIIYELLTTTPPGPSTWPGSESYGANILTSGRTGASYLNSHFAWHSINPYILGLGDPSCRGSHLWPRVCTNQVLYYRDRVNIRAI
jgi:hypothetical protein